MNLLRAFLWAFTLVSVGTVNSAELSGEAAWKALAQPGRIALFRHALAPGGGDPPGFVAGDCSTQRNLSDEGRTQAREIGQQLAKRRIPVAQIWHSEWCRTRETAQLMAQQSGVKEPALQPRPAFNSFFADRSQSAQYTQRAHEELLAWLAKKPKPALLVVVTHQVNITELTGVVPQSGEAVVIEPAGKQWRVIARLQ